MRKTVFHYSSRLRLRHVILVLVLLLTISVYGQSQIIKLPGTKISIQNAINSIEKQTGMSVDNSLSSEKFKSIINLNKRNVRLSYLLDEISKSSESTYVISTNHILLSPITKIKKDINIQQHKKAMMTGHVTDNQTGDPIVGAVVTQRGTQNRTITDVDGNFSIEAPQGSILVISYIGYREKEIKGEKNNIVYMKMSDNMLDEVVAVGYGVQKVSTITGSVSQVKGDKLNVAPIGNVTNTLAGQLPGLVSKQTSGIPGYDEASVNIRNFGSPLIIIDGIESSLSALDPNQIESVSILKDGAASIYGARAGNGVILVTTKRGTQGKPMVSANASFSWQGSANVIKPSSSAQRAQYKRDAWINSGEDPNSAPYTEDEIELFRNGTNPNYLNTDWYGAIIRSLAPMQNHDVTVTGGSDKLKYYAYMGYSRQETIIKTNGGRYEHMNIMTNMDAKLTSNLSLSVDVKYYKQQRLYPSACDGVTNSNNFWRDMIYASDPQYPLYLPDNTKFSYAGITYGSPLFATNSDYGSSNSKVNITIVRSGLTYDFRMIPGLTAKGFVTYKHNEDTNKTFKSQESFYTYNSETETYNFARKSQDPTYMSMSSNDTNLLNSQFSLNYNHTFLDMHNVSAQAIYEYNKIYGSGFNGNRSGFKTAALQEFFAGDATTAGVNSSSSSIARLSYIGRLNYNFKDKYIMEFIFRADASSRYDKGSRWGYFPSISVGWDASKESFVKNLKVFDLLKLRASIGKSGDDSVSNYAYLTGYTYDGSYTFGTTLNSGLVATGLPNPNLTWEKMTIYNAGLDFSLWQRKLYGSFDVFKRHRSGIPGQRSQSMPSTFGANLPTENLNSINTEGFEFSVGTAGSIRDFRYDINANISYSRAKWDKYDQASYTDPDEDRLYRLAGRSTDRRIGYVFDGLFTSQEEINKWDCTYEVLNNDNSTLRPGDAKYKDLNGDKIINWRDQKEIGKGTTPHWMYGFNFSLKYKGFDLTGLLQGAFGYTTYVVLDDPETEIKYKNIWSDTNNVSNAYVPRPGGNAKVNWLWSTYRNHNSSYLRLRNLAFGYELPKSVINVLGIQRLRIYFAGTNLFTISNLNKYGIDPEMSESYYAGISYPQQYTFSFGLNITF
jgi:TonB-linked SusC/RagA family outer membrane protein